MSATCPCTELDQSSLCPHINFLKIHLNIIHPSNPGCSKWSLSLWFPHQSPVYTSPLPQTRCMPRPSHSSRLVHPKSIWWAAQIIKLLIMLVFSSPLLPQPSWPKREEVTGEWRKLTTPHCKKVSYYEPFTNKCRTGHKNYAYSDMVWIIYT